MATNRLGPGTINVQVNWLHEEREVLGQMATNRDMSLGALVRELVHLGLERAHPSIAANLREARRRRRSARLHINLTGAGFTC